MSVPVWSLDYGLSQVDTTHSDLGLLAGSFVTGMVDSVTFLTTGTFVGMQTGNTLLLGLSVSGIMGERHQPYAYASTLISLASFWLGSFLGQFTARKTAPLRRLTVVLFHLVQAALIFLAAALSQANIAPSTTDEANLSHRNIFVDLAPLGIQSGIQVASSRVLGFNEIPVSVLTSAYADIFGDKNLLKLDNPKRNRRVFSAILLFLGAMCSSWIMQAPNGVAIALWTGAGVKTLAGLLMWFVVPNKKQVESD